LVIIGGGAAGLAAGLAAAEKGASIIILEKRSALGGNAIMAGGIFAAESPTQKRAMIDLRRDDCFRTAMNYAHWKINPLIVRVLIDRSGDTIRWLEEKGLNFTCFPEALPGQGGFHLPNGAGAGLIKHLAGECKKRGVKILSRTQAKKIITGKKSEVSGVQAIANGEEFIIKTKSIIISTGGYGGNKKLLKKYCSDYRDNMTCYGVPNMGDGLVMAMALGADTEGLGIMLMAGPTLPKSIQLHIGTEPNVIRVQLSALILEPNTMWVNNRGKRFCDESIGFNHFESANPVVIQPDNASFTLFDSKILQDWIEQGFILGMGTPLGVQGKRLQGLERAIQEQAERGWVKIADTWDQIADWIGADPKILKATIEEYNANCENGYDPTFNKGRKYLVSLRLPPYYAIKARTDILGTIGGIKINEHMEVLDKKGKPIPGLYSAGIDTGGWSSESYNGLLPGNAFGFSINAGRIAGENAIDYVKSL